MPDDGLPIWACARDVKPIAALASQRTNCPILSSHHIRIEQNATAEGLQLSEVGCARAERPRDADDYFTVWAFILESHSTTRVPHDSAVRGDSVSGDATHR